jgi:hypothetical protein
MQVKKAGVHDSDANLRKHLGLRHGGLVNNVLFPSQQRSRPRPIVSSPMPINRKRELDNAAVKCIALDLRCFNDFKKEGIQKLLFFVYKNIRRSKCFNLVQNKPDLLRVITCF